VCTCVFLVLCTGDKTELGWAHALYFHSCTAPVCAVYLDQYVSFCDLLVGSSRSVAELMTAILNTGIGSVVGRSGQGQRFTHTDAPMLLFTDKVRYLEFAHQP
jgi:hypothetical protein